MRKSEWNKGLDAQKQVRELFSGSKNRKVIFCQGPTCAANSHTSKIFQVDDYEFCESCGEKYRAAKKRKAEKLKEQQQKRDGLGWGAW